MILLGVFIFTYTLVGLELFAYRRGEDELDVSRFDTFLQSFLSVFIVLANDNWTSIYFAYYRTTEKISTTIFFVTLIIIGQLILLNLFTAVIVENFEQISVRNDLVNKLSDLKGNSLFERMSKFVCFWKKKVKIKPNNKIDQLTDEEYMEKQRLLDE